MDLKTSLIYFWAAMLKIKLCFVFLFLFICTVHILNLLWIQIGWSWIPMADVICIAVTSLRYTLLQHQIDAVDTGTPGTLFSGHLIAEVFGVFIIWFHIFLINMLEFKHSETSFTSNLLLGSTFNYNFRFAFSRCIRGFRGVFPYVLYATWVWQNAEDTWGRFHIIRSKSRLTSCIVVYDVQKYISTIFQVSSACSNVLLLISFFYGEIKSEYDSWKTKC